MKRLHNEPPPFPEMHPIRIRTRSCLGGIITIIFVFMFTIWFSCTKDAPTQSAPAPDCCYEYDVKKVEWQIKLNERNARIIVLESIIRTQDSILSMYRRASEHEAEVVSAEAKQ